MRFIDKSKRFVVLYSLLALFVCPAFGHAFAPNCADAFSGIDPRIVLSEQLSEQHQNSAIEYLGDTTILHYSTFDGIQGILKSNRIIGDAKRRAFLTREGFSPYEAQNSLFIGSTRATGHGDYVIILKRRSGAEFETSPQNPFELVFHGSYRFRTEDILYVGVNPFL